MGNLNFDPNYIYRLWTFKRTYDSYTTYTVSAGWFSNSSGICGLTGSYDTIERAMKGAAANKLSHTAYEI